MNFKVVNIESNTTELERMLGRLPDCSQDTLCVHNVTFSPEGEANGVLIMSFGEGTGEHRLLDDETINELVDVFNSELCDVEEDEDDSCCRDCCGEDDDDDIYVLSKDPRFLIDLKRIIEKAEAALAEENEEDPFDIFADLKKKAAKEDAEDTLKNILGTVFGGNLKFVKKSVGKEESPKKASRCNEDNILDLNDLHEAFESLLKQLDKFEKALK